jgi:very-short-patch-repair endonuclease
MRVRLARELRKKVTDAEKFLWSKIRKRQILGHKFRRQHPIGRYIVDFVCLEKKLVIELDGSQHLDKKDYDQDRSAWLVQNGYRVLRFWNNDVFKETEGILEVIRRMLEGESTVD